MTTKTQATIEDLYQIPGNGKAEIVNGELVLMSPTGFWPSRASGAIYACLREHERKTKSGYALPDNILGRDIIKSYHSSDPHTPIVFRRGDLADAGDAVPGWSMPVDDLLPEEE